MRIDLNSDLGESFGRWSVAEDRAMLQLVTSANIACGFHAGDPATMNRTVRAAAANDVNIGAHVAYPDLVGFGRRNMDVDPADLEADITYQIGALQAFAGRAGAQVTYVKPHGALYNTIARGGRQAEAVITALQGVDSSLALMCLAGTPLEKLAHNAGVHVVSEAFADRAYRPDGTLVPRNEDGSVFTDASLVGSRMVQLATTGTISAQDGSLITLDPQSICVHGDTPGAVHVAQAVRKALEEADVSLVPFIQN
ncbi:MAG: LamB/YcsF family protein [Canibacter sp.]